MERLFGFLLLGTFLEAGAFASETQFDDLSRLRHILRALFDNSLHVGAFSTN